MNYVSYAQMTQDVTKWAESIPKPYLVVGVPRSGMLPATILALYWNCRLASLDEFVDGKIMGQGYRGEDLVIQNVLVVEDSYLTGSSMNKARELINKMQPTSVKIKYGAIYSAVEKPVLDYYYKLIPGGRFFQWNWRYHKNLINLSCFDIDGVLCVKPTAEQNDDGERYRHFILNTKPLHIPPYKIGMIITSRLEKFRPETEAWLKKHNVQYNELRMLKYPTGAFRRRMGHHGVHKANHYSQTNCKLFVEDEKWQAQEIAYRTGRSVLCVTDWKIYGGNER